MVFRDPRNSFKGLKNYKTIFWSLRFHGNLFFKRLSVDVQRIWQPEDTQIRCISQLFRDCWASRMSTCPGTAMPVRLLLSSASLCHLRVLLLWL